MKKLWRKRQQSGSFLSGAESPGKVNHLIGTTVVAEPTKRPVADIVCVHGLSGGYQTWTKDDILWPRDLLPKMLPEVRVILFGHASGVMDFFTSSSLSGRSGGQEDISRDLLSSLARLRRDPEARERPLLFVAHSLGGTIVKNALVEAHKGILEEYGDIATSTFGICFLATPHQGSNRMTLLNTIEGIAKLTTPLSNASIVLRKSERIESVARTDDEFFRWTRGIQRLEIVNFYEELPTAPFGMIVDRASASLPAYPSASIHASHSGMTKFASLDDVGLKKIMFYLRDMLETQTEISHQTESAEAIISIEGDISSTADVSGSIEQEVRNIIRSQDYERAETLQKQLVETSETSLGEGHETTIRREMALSDIYIIRGMLSEAAEAVDRILNLSEKNFGKGSELHREVKLRADRLSLLNYKCEETWQDYIGADIFEYHLDMADDIEIFFRTFHHWQLDMRTEAIDLLSSFLDIQVGKLGSMSEFRYLQAQSTCNLMEACFFAKTGRKTERRRLYSQERVFHDIREILGKDHPHVIFLDSAFSYMSATSPESDESDVRAARFKTRRQTFALRELLGPEHPICLTLGYNLALLCAAVGEYGEGLDNLERASRSAHANLHKRHLLSIKIDNALEDLPDEKEDAIFYMRKNMLVPTVDIGMCILVPPIEHDLVATFFEPNPEKGTLGTGELLSGLRLESSGW